MAARVKRIVWKWPLKLATSPDKCAAQLGIRKRFPQHRREANPTHSLANFFVGSAGHKNDWCSAALSKAMRRFDTVYGAFQADVHEHNVRCGGRSEPLSLSRGKRPADDFATEFFECVAQ